MARPERYSRNQLIAHWLVVFLVGMQFLMNDQMSAAYGEGVDSGTLPVLGGVTTHAFGGTLIFLVMLWRGWMRYSVGTPPPTREIHKAVGVISRINHYAFYVVLMAMPVAGWLAITTLEPIWGELHEAAAVVLLILIALHVAGALVHLFRSGDHTTRRMLRPDPADRRSEQRRAREDEAVRSRR